MVPYEAAAKYHDAQADNAKKRYSELDRYADTSDEREGWRSWKDAEDRYRSYAAGIRLLKSHAGDPSTLTKDPRP